MVPRTSPPLILTFLLNFDVRIERAALGRTLLNGLQLLRTLVAVKGDEYLEPDDDPWEIDDKLSGKCYGMSYFALPCPLKAHHTLRDILVFTKLYRKI